MNILFILVTDNISKFEISKETKFLQLQNIFSILNTFEVSKFCSKLIKFEHNSNIPSIFPTLDVLKSNNFISVNEEQF